MVSFEPKGVGEVDQVQGEGIGQGSACVEKGMELNQSQNSKNARTCTSKAEIDGSLQFKPANTGYACQNQPR